MLINYSMPSGVPEQAALSRGLIVNFSALSRVLRLFDTHRIFIETVMLHDDWAVTSLNPGNLTQ